MTRMMKSLVLIAVIAPTILAAQTIVKQEPKNPAPEVAGLERLPSPPGASVKFRNLKDGDVVGRSFRVKFDITGMKVRAAGTDDENSGHHHLLIDVDELPPLNLPLPKNEAVHHFGKAEKSAVISMPPGEHTLQLLFADYRHIPHDPPVMSEKISITVK